MQNYDCQVFPCKICCQNSRGNDATRVVDGGKAFSGNGRGSGCGSSSTSPCGMCSSSNGDFSGSLVVDAIAALIFFFFWMMQFWLSMASCVYEAMRYLCNSDRSIQIVAGSVSVLIFGLIILHGVVGGGGGCCKDKAKMHAGGDAGGKGVSVNGKVSLNADGSFNANTNTNANTNSKLGRKPQPPQAHLKISLKDGKAGKGTVEKTFYLTIMDEKKKKLFETSSSILVPVNGEKPTLVLTTDPIILEDY